MEKKNITSVDIAKLAGVSQTTVSYVLNNTPGRTISKETKERVLSIAKKLNYRMNVNARNMKNGRAGIIGVLSFWGIGTFMFSQPIEGIEKVCTKNDIGIMICTGAEDSSGTKDYMKYYLQNRIDGMIIISRIESEQNKKVVYELENNNIPFVCVSGDRDVDGISCVDVDFVESGYMAGKHLMEMGYSKVAYMYPIKNRIFAEEERLQGCKRAVDECGKTLDVLYDFSDVKDDETILKNMIKVLKSGKYDAFVGNARRCMTVLKAAIKLNINVPDEIGVISYENSDYANYLYPELTTIDQPLTEIGNKAACVLMKKLEDNSVCEKIACSPKIVVRKSTQKQV